MKTTYARIKEFKPRHNEWDLLIKNTNPKNDMYKKIDLMDILKSNGIIYAVWSLRCFAYKDWCLFAADVSESVLSVFEAKYSNDDRPRKAIKAIRDYKDGKISSQELKNAAIAARDAADATALCDTAACAAANSAAIAAGNAANVYDAEGVAAEAAFVAGDLACYAYTSDAWQKKWREIEQLFIIHFGDE